MVTLPLALVKKLAELKISETPNFIFESSSTVDGGTGDSWLLIFTSGGKRSRMVALQRVPLGDVELYGDCSLEVIDKISAEQNFIGNVKLTVTKKDGAIAFHFSVPGLQKESWPQLFHDIESLTTQTINWEQSQKSADFFGGNFKIFDGGSFGESAANPSALTWNAPMDLDIVEVAPDSDTTMNRLAFNTQVSMSQKGILISEVTNDQQDMVEVQEEKTGTPLAEVRDKRSIAHRKAPPPPPPAKPAVSEKGQVKCKKCGQTNKPEYVYCLGCGGQLRTPTARGRSGVSGAGIPTSNIQGYSTEAGGGGCLSQLFMIVVFMFAILIALSIFNP